MRVWALPTRTRSLLCQLQAGMLEGPDPLVLARDLLFQVPQQVSVLVDISGRHCPSLVAIDMFECTAGNCTTAHGIR